MINTKLFMFAHILLLVGGCQSVLVHNEGQICQKIGFSQGTTEYAQCMMQLMQINSNRDLVILRGQQNMKVEPFKFTPVPQYDPTSRYQPPINPMSLPSER